MSRAFSLLIVGASALLVAAQEPETLPAPAKVSASQPSCSACQPAQRVVVEVQQAPAIQRVGHFHQWTRISGHTAPATMAYMPPPVVTQAFAPQAFVMPQPTFAVVPQAVQPTFTLAIAAPAPAFVPQAAVPCESVKRLEESMRVATDLLRMHTEILQRHDDTLKVHERRHADVLDQLKTMRRALQMKDAN